jgi:hypothetical protein
MENSNKRNSLLSLDKPKRRAQHHKIHVENANIEAIEQEAKVIRVLMAWKCLRCQTWKK